MSLAEIILHDVQAMGGVLTAKNGRLKVSASTPLPQALLERVRKAKPALLAALQPTAWTAADWQEYFEERVGIVEHDSMIRRKAERHALEGCTIRWMNLNPPAHADSYKCLHCQQDKVTALVSVLSHGGGRFWLHKDCFGPWWKHRRQEAIKHLKTVLTFAKKDVAIE